MNNLLARLQAATAQHAPAAHEAFWRMPGRLAYIVNHSYPFSSNGYAVRTHGVAKALVEQGHSVVAITRPGRPWDLPGFSDEDFAPHHDIDGVRYLHLPRPSGSNMEQAKYIAAAADALKETLRVFKPSAIVAASNWENALPAAIAARELGLPFFYEVRGFWEISRASQEPAWKDSQEFRHCVAMESLVAKSADRVFTLNRFMRDELVKRGVDADKVDLVPNAWSALPKEAREGHSLRNELGIKSKFVVGYVGSFNDYEGLDDLVQACARLRKEDVDLSLLLAGGSDSHGIAQTKDECQASTRLKRLAQEQGLAGHVHFLGRVARERVPDCYAAIDLVVLPRKAVEVCELVSPLKPLEVAAYGKPLLLSDVAPHAEFAAASNLAVTYRKGDVTDLARQLKQSLKDLKKLEAGLAKHRHWLEANSWTETVRPISTAYRAVDSAWQLGSAYGAQKPGSIVHADPKLQFVSILDEISDASWKTEFKLYPVNRKNFKDQIRSSNSEAMFLESCWKGNRGSWEYAFTSPGLKHANAQALCEAIDLAKGRGMPVVFWNKEDPMHYDKFMPIASRCDYIFTTDSNKVEDYKRDVPGAKVDALAFAANPLLCNPAERFKKEPGSVCFAGSYYSVGHEDRKVQMDNLLPTIIAFDGVIYDRMSKLENDRYAYPPQYKPHIRDAVPFTEIVNVYKQYKIFLNVNTITDSPTMMSRRVYELLACGTPVISTPSVAIDAQFDGIVQVAANAEEANRIAERLLSNEWEWLKLSHRGYREVMLKHTYTQRADQVAAALGRPVQRAVPKVSIIMATNRPHYIDRLVTNIARQNHPNLELVLVTQNYPQAAKLELARKLNDQARNLSSVTFIHDDSAATLGARLNRAMIRSTGDYIAKMDDDDFYFENYLQDMLLPFSFGDYGIVGKREVFVHLEGQNKTIIRFKGERHKQTNFVAGPTFVISRNSFRKLQFADVNRGEDTSLLENAAKNGIKIYASDPFNFIQFRSSSAVNHTWQVEDKFFMEKGEVVGDGVPLDIVAV